MCSPLGALPTVHYEIMHRKSKVAIFTYLSICLKIIRVTYFNTCAICAIVSGLGNHKFEIHKRHKSLVLRLIFQTEPSVCRSRQSDCLNHPSASDSRWTREDNKVKRHRS